MKVLIGTTARLAPEQPIEDVQLAGHPMPPDAAHLRIDELERQMLDEGDLVDMPLMHLFTPGLYARTIFMPAGTVATSKIHKTEHPFMVVQGRVSVFIPGETPELLVAPHMGVTTAGTRRVLMVHEDTIWTTFHVNPDDTTDLDTIESRIIEQRTLEDGSTVYNHYARQLDENISTSIRPCPELEPPIPESQQDYTGAP